MRIPATKDFLERVRAVADIVQVIGDYVPLRKAGTRFKGLCPFHAEKTPSFSVDPERQLFYCFGCQTGGDAFKFVQLYEKVDFVAAVEVLARRLGVPIPEPEGPASELRRVVLAVNEAAEAFFRSVLNDREGGRKALAYLERRGVRAETADRLRLGASPDAWEALRDHLAAKRFTVQEMMTAGLVLPRKDGAGQYDRFRDRLIFPIREVSGRTIAFGGRILGDGEPKYLNSPETPAYTKGEHLYGLDLAREAIRREGFAIVVEGYLDLAALLQAGFDNALASLGTAFTAAQARLLSRYTGRVVISYDGDAAGSAAAARSLDLLLDRGLEVRVAELPSGKDPDDFLRDSGPAAYDATIRGAPGYFEFLVRREVRSRDLSLIEEKVSAINSLLPHLVRLPSPVERASWAGHLADALDIEDDLVLQELRTALRSARPAIRYRAAAQGAMPPEAEVQLVTFLLHDPDGPLKVADRMEARDLEGARVAPIVDAILRLGADGAAVTYPGVFDALDREEDRELLTRIAFQEGEIPRDQLPMEVDDCLNALRCRRLQREGRELQRTIESSDLADVDELLRKKMQLAKQIDALS